jgi:hypothetical protein
MILRPRDVGRLLTSAGISVIRTLTRPLQAFRQIRFLRSHSPRFRNPLTNISTRLSTLVRSPLSLSLVGCLANPAVIERPTALVTESFLLFVRPVQTLTAFALSHLRTLVTQTKPEDYFAVPTRR